MGRMLVRRLLGAIPLLLAVVLVVFVLMDLAPTDPAQRVAGDTASEEVIAEVRSELRLDRSLPVRYGHWIADAVRGDLGESLITGEEVGSRLWSAVPITASLAGLSLVVSTVVGLVAGVAAATRPNSWLDRTVTAGASLAIAIPSFWFGLLLVLIFAIQLGWLPAIGYRSPIDDGFWEWLRHMIMPVVALSALFTAEVARQLRGSLVDVMESHYVLAARARGIPRRVVLFKHALKNAMGPVTTITGFRVAQLIGGTVLVEQVFVLRGIGSLSIDAAFQGDVPSVLGVTVITLLAVVAMNMLVDVSYGYFNPRARS